MLRAAGMTLVFGWLAFGADDPASVLARILAQKGTITTAELEQVQAASAAGRVDVLAALLEKKGLLTSGEMASLGRSAPPIATRPSGVVASTNSGQPPPSKPEAPAPAVTSQSKSPVT